MEEGQWGENHGCGVGWEGLEGRRECHMMTLDILDHTGPAGGQGVGFKNEATEKF